jgi:UDP-N-acetylmuramoyl-tripeptide--D-alanyl-D-alanine ligase
MRLKLADVRARLTGEPSGPAGERIVRGASTDTRTIEPGQLFFCLKGPNFDAHDFAAAAVDKGAVAVVAQRQLDIAAPQILVEDVQQALGRLARSLRDQTRARVVGVTGTAGKTTTKEMLALALSAAGLCVAKNHKNLNNQIGLPLSMLTASGDEDVWVMELGISRPHDMDELGAILAPDVGLVVNVGPAHLDGLKSLAGVARAKAALFRHVRPGGVCLACRDYPQLYAEAGKAGPGVRWFSTKSRRSEFFCSFDGVEADGRGRFRLKVPGRSLQAVLPLFGAHQAENLAAVAAAVHCLGADLTAAIRGLGAFAPQDQRFELRRAGGWLIVDDSYNANPLSMIRAVATARVLAGGRPLVLVLGDMKELGDKARAAHERLGKALRSAAPAVVLFQGEFAADVGRTFGLNGSAGRFSAVAGPEETAEVLRGLGLPAGVVLVKGSRSCRMERHTAAIERLLGGADRGM